MTRRTWTVRLSNTAEADYDEILHWTAKQFGAAQATSYATLLAEALARLEHGPTITGARQRDDIGARLYTLHIGRPGRHIILFQIGSTRVETIDVLRILHDAMDIVRHVPWQD